MTLLNRVRNALLPEGTLCMPLRTKSTRRAISATARKSVAHHGSSSRNQRYSSTPAGMVTTPARGRHHYLMKEVKPVAVPYWHCLVPVNMRLPSAVGTGPTAVQRLAHPNGRHNPALRPIVGVSSFLQPASSRY